MWRNYSTAFPVLQTALLDSLPLVDILARIKGTSLQNLSLSQDEIEKRSLEFESASPQEIIEWAVNSFVNRIAVSSSFQTQSLPLLHMISQIKPETPILFLDTGYHFWETLIFREQLERDMGLTVQNLYPDSSWQPFFRRYGRDLIEQDPDLCCFVRKVQPMQKALKGLSAWISGIRRDQTAFRKNAKILEVERGGLIKVNPLLNWTKEDLKKYIEDHHLPAHPLLQKGYRSIGCKPCTIAIGLGEDERAGRWQGRGKIECGLHTELFNQDSPKNGAAITPNDISLLKKEE